MILNRRLKISFFIIEIICIIPFILYLYFSRFSIGSIIAFVFWTGYIMLNILENGNTLFIYKDRLVLKNQIKKDKTFYFKDIKEITVYREKSLYFHNGNHYLTITFHEKVKEGYFNKKKSPQFDCYNRQDMELIYNELKKRDVVCTFE